MKYHLLKSAYKFLLLSLSIVFVFAGINKIFHIPSFINDFNTMRIPIPLMIVVGFTEISLGILLHIRYFTKLALQGLLFIMIFACIFTMITEDHLSIILPIIIIILIFLTLELGQRVRNLKYDHNRR